MKNKLLTSAIVLILASVLLVTIPIMPTSASPAELHVGSGQTYSTIQAAVNAASSGDTIIVHDGTYPESVSVGTDNITILSDTLHGALVDPPGAGSCFTVTADNVTIDGFELNGTSSGYGIGFSGSHNTFSNNKIHNINSGGTGGGICCWDTGTAGPSNHNNISNNEIYDVSADGILTGCCRNDTVMDGNVITGNTIYNFATQDGWNPGIEEVNGKNYVISNNNITGSTQYYGILHTSWNGISQSGNTISGNNVTGVLVGICMMADTGEGSGFGGVIHGFTAPSTVLVKDSVIEDNNLYENVYHGLVLDAFGGSTTNATISGIRILNNNIHDNTYKGIYFYTRMADDTIKDNLIQGNELTRNDVGAKLRAITAGGTLTNNTFHSNNFYNNTAYGIEDPTSTLIVYNNTIEGGRAGIFLGPDAISPTVKGNTITDFVKAGIVTRGAKNILIEGNTISTTIHDEAPNGIDIGMWTGTNGTVKDNEISGCSWKDFTGDYETSWSGSGILVIESDDSLEIRKNIVHDCDVGMDIESDSMNITCNDVHSNIYGFVFWNAKPKVNCNKIYNNTQYGVYRTASGDLMGVLNAERNWWGDDNGPGNETGSTGDYVSNNVDYDPWIDWKNADVNDDWSVDIRDIGICCKAFGSTPSDPRWYPRADLNGDNLIDIYDLVAIALNFGKKCPCA